MKRKMLFITLAFMFVLLIFCNNSFASTEIEVDGTTYIMPDWWSQKKYKMFFDYYNLNYYFLFASDYPFIANKDNEGIYFKNSGFYFKSISKSSVNNNDLTSLDFIELTTSNGAYWHKSNLSNLLYTSHDVYDVNNTLVFQAPPQVLEEVTLKTVLEKQKENNPQMVMKEIIIILPMILVVVVSYLGLRKALAMLSAVLHRS